MPKSPEGGPAPEQREQETPSISFHVAEYGLETSLDEVLSDDEFNSRDPEEFEPNRNWYSVTVANEADQKRWTELRNQYLDAAWTPNQDEETREENAEIMRKAEQEMRELENKVRREE